MKKYIILIFICIFACSFVFATASGPDHWKVRNVASNDVLNIREKTTWRSNKLGEIPYNGNCIQNLGCVGGLTFEESMNLSKEEKEIIKMKRPRWCKIKYNGIEGWVSGRYLMEGECKN